jgi:putative pyruvate formate lyase activating enzyme
MLFSDHEPDFAGIYKSCELCPRACRVDRTHTRHGEAKGFCGETDQVRVAHVGPHFGEEPPITGIRGSGTVFFSGCSLKCKFCQNHQISLGGMGETLDFHGLLEEIRQMILNKGVHNLNFVTPDHFMPHTVGVVSHLKKEHPGLPILYNFSGYQSVNMLKGLETYADIYLPDFKYSDTALARKLSGCADYPGKAIDAISEMVRQKGLLDCLVSEEAVATQGVLVRHLILPGAIENSINALTTLFIEFGPDLPISLMSQYHPVVHHEDSELNRTITDQEFEEVHNHAIQLGFRQMFVQFPEDYNGPSRVSSSFLPDFKKRKPFKV